ncbi:DUF3800 domain-containing protein [uncultured Clostridium sp.]|uniref:DUF3800 domain-containing protein n=1 Tax=uncultured Clostridium sp. TaxID=59620 RepID=UPI0025E046D7|nr:DUF3800 domain-containing protein [uncultured Clostridium sp.]
MKDYYLYFDESGNLGVQNRYFVIACILTEKPKELENKIKKVLLDIKKHDKTSKWNGHELKANSCKPWTKEKIYKAIVSKDIQLSYIVADKIWIEEKLKEDKNCLYNYLLSVLLDNFKNTFRGNKINLILDNKSIKVKSLNSFEDYIKIHINYKLKLNCDIKVEYRDSSAKNAYNIQAVDYIANLLFGYYEYNYDKYYKIIENKITYVELFPRRKFGRVPEVAKEIASTKS